MTDDIDFSTDPELSLPTEHELSKLTTLALQLKDVEADIAQLESQLAEQSELKKRLTMDLIPGIMDQLRLKEFKLKDGSQITVTDVIQCGLPKEPERREQALAYLVDKGAESIIKNEVSVTFGKGQAEMAKQAEEALKKIGFEPLRDETVHPQTLSSWAKEQVNQGLAIPADLFSLFIGKKAKVKGGTT